MSRKKYSQLGRKTKKKKQKTDSKNKKNKGSKKHKKLKLKPSDVDYSKIESINKRKKASTIKKRLMEAGKNKTRMNQGRMNQGRMNQGRMNQGRMNKDMMNRNRTMNKSMMNQGRMNQGRMNKSMMNQGRMNREKSKSKKRLRSGYRTGFATQKVEEKVEEKDSGGIFSKIDLSSIGSGTSLALGAAGLTGVGIIAAKLLACNPSILHGHDDPGYDSDCDGISDATEQHILDEIRDNPHADHGDPFELETDGDVTMDDLHRYQELDHGPGADSSDTVGDLEDMHDCEGEWLPCVNNGDHCMKEFHVTREASHGMLSCHDKYHATDGEKKECHATDPGWENCDHPDDPGRDGEQCDGHTADYCGYARHGGQEIKLNCLNLNPTEDQHSYCQVGVGGTGQCNLYEHGTGWFNQGSILDAAQGQGIGGATPDHNDHSLGVEEAMGLCQYYGMPAEYCIGPDGTLDPARWNDGIDAGYTNLTGADVKSLFDGCEDVGAGWG